METKDKDGNIKTSIIEIKPKKQTKEPQKLKKSKRTMLSESITFAINTAKWESAKQFCDKHEISFKILTEEELF